MSPGGIGFRHPQGPALRPIPGVDPRAYGRTVIERFGNPEIQDPLTRICADTSERIPKFLLPVVTAQLEFGGPVRQCAAVVASWPDTPKASTSKVGPSTSSIRARTRSWPPHRSRRAT